MYFASLCVQPLSVVSLLQPDGAARTRERRPTPTAHADAAAHAVRQEMQKPSAFKSEWATVKDGSLVVGSTGADRYADNGDAPAARALHAAHE